MKKIYLNLAFVSAYLGMLSKETALTGLLVIPVIFYIYSNEKPKEIILKIVPILGAIILFFIQKSILIKGAIIPVDIINYPYTEDYVNKQRAFGELGHPETPTINLDRVSHIIVSLKEDGNQWIGKAKILDTPMGNIARSLIEGGAQLGVSSRGMGSLKAVNGVNIVQDDFHLATAADIVADPSAPGAFVQVIMEGKEWVFVNGIWTEQHIEESKKLMKKASRKDIEKVSLQIFENFIKKL
jgi:hypothetical protein